MTHVKYIDLPFSSETATGDFYTYSSLRDLAKQCEEIQNDLIRCRTVGILQSVHGKFYLSELDSEARRSGPLIQLSVVYLKSPLPSTVVPYPVQVFGCLQWRNRPVIYAKIVQVLKISMALRINNTMKSLSRMHLARKEPEDRIEDTSLNDSMCDWSTWEMTPN